MALIGKYKTIRAVRIVSKKEIDEMRVYLRGMVYSWCATRGRDPFAARDILGNVNRIWTGTPMQPLFDYYHDVKRYDVAKSKNLAGRAAGWLLMRVLADDAREFFTYVAYVRQYEWRKPE